jgi:putative oxidoreductase
MADQLRPNPSTRLERPGHTGIYPASGPPPAGPAPARSQGELAHPEERRRSITGRTEWPGNSVMLWLGRTVFGGYFLYNGINHFLNRESLVEYARTKGVPMPAIAVAGSGILIVLGGLSLLAGAKPRVGTALITTFLAGVTPSVHTFWNETDEARWMEEFVNFTKNIALIGGACFAAALPERWPGSVPLERGGALMVQS